MADQNITALPVATSPASSDQILLVGETEEKLIDYDKLADAILQKLTSKQYTLDQGTKTLTAALNELNSKPFLRYEKAFGESLTIKNVRAATHGLIIIEKAMVVFYLGGSINIGYTVTTYGKHSNDDTNSVSALYARNISISDDRFSTVEEFKAEFERLYNAGTPIVVYYIMNTPKEIDLTEEEIAAFKSLATYYPATNLSVNSEQLDGYTVFNYPISMKNGWDYVKKQLNDNRDYIYDMDIQSAEAYVNSEYAVALTELEV